MTSKTTLRRRFKLLKQLNCAEQVLRLLTEQQLEYIFSGFRSPAYLDACPGSGKTEVIGWKVAYEISKWKSGSSGIVVTSFTKSAANELIDRIKRCGGDKCIKFPHFLGTFDSWLHNYILHPFAADVIGYKGNAGDKSFRIIENDSDAGFLASFKTSITYEGKRLDISVVDYHYENREIICDKTKIEGVVKSLGAEDLKVLKQAKAQFFKNGFCTYADAETLVMAVLKKRPKVLHLLSKRFPIIIIDECQDLSLSQIAILEMLRANGTILHFIGDLNQSIYEFRKVNPADTEEYMKKIGCVSYRLTTNFRSCQPIVDATQATIGKNGKVKGHQDQLIPNPCILLKYDDHDFHLLPQKYNEIITTYRLNPENCAILARGKSTLNGLKEGRSFYSLKVVELIANALNYWFSSNRSTDDITNAFVYLGKAFASIAYNGRGNKQKFYCPDNFEPIAWRIFLRNSFNELKSLYPFEEGGKALVWTKWVLRLKVKMQDFYANFPECQNEWDKAQRRFRSPDNEKDNPVSSGLNNNILKGNIKTTTIHSVKGQTLDSVLVVSHRDKSSKGGHFSHWIPRAGVVEEHLRFAYVAFSRPKHLLIIAMRTNKDKDLQHFRNIGFELHQ